ncbi:nuclear transport factor 2 family protein [Marinihelvus fidelis]|uniref:Nuclear transport factor 2 family protein n=1 Tax=Marinihelvus fidelis TaxID=2613842 RepID=A0A5N0TCU2_9GAMM|nr:nuclear transport factor 2 family protein [Marinihelvus fidelis]
MMPAIVLATTLAWLAPAVADDVPNDVPATPSAEAIVDLLEDFLANVDEAATHDRFWAEDLVYTSSDGTRRGKAEIMAGFDEPAADEPGPEVTYSGRDIRIREYGNTATVAFRLVANVAARGDAPARELAYFNTGTFVQRDGQWQVVAWQATRIPGSD